VLAANTPKFTGAVPPEARRRLARWHEAEAALRVPLLRPNLSAEEPEFTRNALRPLATARA